MQPNIFLNIKKNIPNHIIPENTISFRKLNCTFILYRKTYIETRYLVVFVNKYYKINLLKYDSTIQC